MGTRGFVGFVVDGQEKIAYNHFDSYPSELGVHVLQWARSVEDWQEIRELAATLRLVSDDSPPTSEDVAMLGDYYDGRVGGTSAVSWYQLLRKTQGDMAAILAAGALEDASEFPYDSLFAEWGYIVDLDANRLEVYKGFQEEPHKEGRFATRGADRGYYPVRMIASWPLDALPDSGRMLDLDK
jgi:hypothetical protein